jgi:hypothetical protein
MSKKYDVVSEATALVHGQLELLHALYQANQTLAEGKSRRVCRCTACGSHRKTTLAWLDNILTDDEAERIRLARYPATAAINKRLSLRSD